jgi:hypothetical protein
MSDFSPSEMEAALAHFKRLRSGGSLAGRPTGSHVNQTIRSLEGQLLRHSASPRNARFRAQAAATAELLRRA